MKNIRKWKLAAFVMALVLTMAGTVGLVASADNTGEPTAIQKGQIEVDYEKETITVTSDDKIVYFTETYNKDVTKWSACEVREIKKGNTTVNAAVFDISWVSDNKIVRLYLCGDKNTKVVNVDIAWEESFNVTYTGTLLTTDVTEAETWQKVYEKYPNFSEDTGYFIFTIEEDGRDMSYFPDDSLDTIQWRKGDDGVWRNYKELDLKEMNIRGISLEFRVVASNVAGAEAKASSTARISVAKIAVAPPVAVNPDTMSVDVKNGMEFSFDKKEWVMVPEYNKKFGAPEYMIKEEDRKKAIETIYTTERISKLLIQDILESRKPGFTTNTPMDYASIKAMFGEEIAKPEGIVLYIRNISSARKAASKITEVTIPYTPSEMARAEDAEMEGAKIKFSYGESKTNTGGIVVENNTDYKYQVGVIIPTDELYGTVDGYKKAGTPVEDYDLDVASVKWTSVKNGKMMKISNKKVPEGSYLIYRIGGEVGSLPSTYRIYGPMKYDHIAFAGIGTATMMAGQKLSAVPSTNFKADESGNYAGLTFTWQSSTDKLAKNWSYVSSGPTLILNDAMVNHYIRVVIKDAYDNEKISDPVGPVKPAPTPTPAGGADTPTP